MSVDELSAPLVKQPNVSACEINDLCDNDLAEIFKRLPPYDRLLVSRVCKRWLGVNRVAWTDVSHLDLSAIPGSNIGAIVQLCPRLKTVFASGKAFSKKQLRAVADACIDNPSSLKLYDCSCIIPGLYDALDIFSAAFSERCAEAAVVWSELVLAGFKVVVEFNRLKEVTGRLPRSLRRLQLSGVDISQQVVGDASVSVDSNYMFLSDIWRLRDLTCLVLTYAAGVNSQSMCLVGAALSGAYLFRSLALLKNLRELCLGWDTQRPCAPRELASICRLPKLEVLFLANAPVDVDDKNLAKLATKHPTLRFLLFAGALDGQYSISSRRLQSNGFNAALLPLLHVFVGKEASEKILFTKSSPDALKIHPIRAPLHEFLEMEEIASIF